MTTLVLGATGATGERLAKQLLNDGQNVRMLVRDPSKVSQQINEHPKAEVFAGNLLNLSPSQQKDLVDGCHTVISCLGHNLTFRGMFGAPRKLVLEHCKAICSSVESLKPRVPVKYILMNTSGNQNKLAGEKIPLKHALVVGLLRIFLPPHRDNELAAHYLQTQIATTNEYIKWCVVRPDSLHNMGAVSGYTLHESPLSDPIFDSKKTSRENVANFMMQLSADDSVWSQWVHQMPIIYDLEQHR